MGNYYLQLVHHGVMENLSQSMDDDLLWTAGIDRNTKISSHICEDILSLAYTCHPATGLRLSISTDPQFLFTICRVSTFLPANIIYHLGISKALKVVIEPSSQAVSIANGGP